MIASFELGKNKIFAVLMEGETVIHRFSVDVKSLDGSRIGDPEECAAALRENLAQLEDKVKQCIFTVPMSMVVSREMNAPKNLSSKNMVSFVGTNLQSLVEINEDEYVAECVYLDKTGDTDVILGIAMRRDNIERCLTVAKLCKLKCVRIDLRVNALHQYMKRSAMLGDRACMAVRVSGSSAEICLFEENRMFNRIVELEAGTDQDTDSLLKNWAVSFNDSIIAAGEKTEKTESLIDKLETLRNFQIGRNRQKPVDNIYFYGDTADVQMDDVQRSMGVQVHEMAALEDMPYIVAIAAAGFGNDDLNLLSAFHQNTHKEKQQRGFLIQIAGVAAVFFVISLAATGILAWNNSHMERKIAEMQSYMTASDTAAKIKEAQSISRQLTAQSQYNEVLKEFNEALETQFRYRSTYIEGVLQVAQTYGVTVDYYDYSDGTLNMTCAAPDSSVAAMYSKTIEESGWASEVTFVGYEKDQKENGSDYAFTIRGTVKETQ